jgi:hypothetical protein
VLDRIISLSLLCGMSACFARTVAHEYALAVNAKLEFVLHALNRFN